MEIVQLVATGATNQQIARDLTISVNTVKVHLRNIYGKLGVASRTEATMVAVREGWVQVSGPEEEPAQPDAALAPPPAAPWPRLEQQPPVSLAKRIALAAAILLALVILFVPQALRSRVNGAQADPISGVFPTDALDPAASRWQSRAQMPTPRIGLAVIEYQGLIYTIGGIGSDGVTGQVEVYDPETNTWTVRRPKPTPAGFVSAALLGDRIYVPGGFDDGRQPRELVEVYDPAADSWQGGVPLPEPLGAYALTTLGEQLYLFGGRNALGYSRAAYRYDPQAARWFALAPMDQARGLLSAAPIGDRIYVVGGYDDVAEYDTCASYDPASDTWSSCAPMDMPRGGLAVIAIRERLYAIGGGMDGFLAYNERYDPRVDAWSRIETPVTEQWRDLGVAFVYPHLYAIGGWNGGFLSVNEAYQVLYQIILP
jgi:DNA-binding CsgD family transcriptional regulator/N-acetylneuraminic acid mutarotase